jgi:hypothetical protein
MMRVCSHRAMRGVNRPPAGCYKRDLDRLRFRIALTYMISA